MLGRSEVISHIIYVLSISFLWKLLCCARTRYEHFIWIDGFSSLTSGYSNCAKYDKNDTYKLDQPSLGCPKPQQLYIYIDFYFYVISEKSTGLACVLTLIWKYTELSLSLSLRFPQISVVTTSFERQNVSTPFQQKEGWLWNVRDKNLG